MSRIGDLMQQRAQETAEMAERLASEEWTKRQKGYALLLKDVLTTIRRNMSDDREARRADRQTADQARRAERKKADEALLSQMTGLVESLDKRQRETLAAIRAEQRNDRWKATLRAALVGGLTGALTLAALLAVVVLFITVN